MNVIMLLKMINPKKTAENTENLKTSNIHNRAPSYLKNYHYQLSNHIDTKCLNNSNKVIYLIPTYLAYGLINILTMSYYIV